MRYQLEKDQVVEYIKNAIIQGKYLDGHRLIEEKLCEELGIKRHRIREALQQLSNDGFVTIVPFQGAFVSTLTPKDIAQTYDILGSIEGLSMRVATASITREEIDKIEFLIERIEQDQDNQSSVYDLNLKLHQYMTELGKNQLAIPFVENLRRRAQRITFANFNVPEQMPASLIEHRIILDTVKERKPLEVERLIVNHYITARDILIKALIYNWPNQRFLNASEQRIRAMGF